MINLEEAKKWYQNADAVHDFAHIERVYRMSERLARAEGADLEIVHAAALLHDADGTTPGSAARLEHHLRSAALAGEVLKKEGWPEDRIAAVQHCIRAHRYRDDREPPATIEAKCIFDADKLDVLGAIGAVRVSLYAALAGMPLYAEPSAHFSKPAKRCQGNRTALTTNTFSSCATWKNASTPRPPASWRASAVNTSKNFSFSSWLRSTEKDKHGSSL